MYLPPDRAVIMTLSRCLPFTHLPASVVKVAVVFAATAAPAALGYSSLPGSAGCSAIIFGLLESICLVTGISLTFGLDSAVAGALSRLTLNYPLLETPIFIAPAQISMEPLSRRCRRCGGSVARRRDVSVHFSEAAMKLGQEPIARRERRPVAMRAYAKRADGSSVEVFLLDLSYEGCGIETPVALSAGEEIQLAVLRQGLIGARVCWCVGRKAGLIFTDDTPPEEGQAEQPRQERAPYRGEALLRRLGAMYYQVQVFDLSHDGCKIELVETPRVGEHVLVKFDHLEALDAEVCWIERKTAGLNFTKSIHPAVFDLLMERLDS
jgi:hypothetical protein